MDRVNRYGIDTIITFDEQGISNHKNHIAVSSACQPLPMDVYTLQTVPIWRKYSSVFDSITLYFKRAPTNRVLYITHPSETMLIQKAMRKGHKSQMLWFRWGWILFSRYLIINELDLMS
jgi:N-acetylglucosaminylphosphatidylinositol deacetylase